MVSETQCFTPLLAFWEKVFTLTLHIMDLTDIEVVRNNNELLAVRHSVSFLTFCGQNVLHQFIVAIIMCNLTIAIYMLCILNIVNVCEDFGWYVHG